MFQLEERTRHRIYLRLCCVFLDDLAYQPSRLERGMTAVVAAVIRRGDRYLLCRRPAGKRHGGLWEFPGGKVLPGETFAMAIRRELAEELGVQTNFVSEPVASIEDGGSDFVIHFLCVEVDGEPTALEHEALGWFSAVEMQASQLAPADRSFSLVLS